MAGASGVGVLGPPVRAPEAPARPRPGGTPTVSDEPFQRITVLVCHLVVVLVGVDMPLTAGVSSALVAGIVLFPLWAPVLRRYALATTIAALAAASACWGVVLSELSAADHSVSATLRVQSIALLLSGTVAIGLVLWCRQHVPLHRIIGLYGLGSLAGAVLDGGTSWKYNLAVPTMFLALGIIEANPRRRRLAAVVLVALGLVSVFDEGRSLFALALLAAVLVLSQSVSAGTARRLGRWSPALVLAAITFALYLAGTALLTGGYLGSTLEERTTEQIETTGSLIAGGRPEWAATWQLFSTRPEGFGPGVAPSWSDYMAGKSGLASINVDTGGYAKYYLFGGQFRLHSVAADLWVSYGLFGVFLAVAILVSLVRSLSLSLASGRARTSVLFACVLGLWYLLFGPIYSNWLDVSVALAFTMLPRSSTDPPRPADPPAGGLPGTRRAAPDGRRQPALRR